MTESQELTRLIGPLLLPAGPHCEILGGWGDIPEGTHASVMGAVATVEYWVSSTAEVSDPEDGRTDREELEFRLTVGAGCGLAAALIQCWLNQYLPGVVLQGYVPWEEWLRRWDGDGEF